MEVFANASAVPLRRGKLSETLAMLLHGFVEGLPLGTRESIAWVQAAMVHKRRGILPDGLARDIEWTEAEARKPFGAEDAKGAFLRIKNQGELPLRDGWVINREGQLPYEGTEVEGRRDELEDSARELFRPGDHWEYCHFAYIPHPGAARWDGALEAAGIFVMCTDWTEVSQVLRRAAEDWIAAMVDAILLAVLQDNAAARLHSEEVDKQATALVDELHNAQSSIRRLRRILRSPSSTAGDAYRAVGHLFPATEDTFFQRWKFQHRWDDPEAISADRTHFLSQVACILLCFEGEKLPPEKDPWDKDEPISLLGGRWEKLGDAYRKLNPYFEDLVATKEVKDPAEAVAVFKWLRAIFHNPFRKPPDGGLTAGMLAHWAAERGCPEFLLRPFREIPESRVGHLKILPAYTIDGLEGIYRECKKPPQLSVPSGTDPVGVEVRFPGCPDWLVAFVKDFEVEAQMRDINNPSAGSAVAVFYRPEINVRPKVEAADVVIEL